MESETEPIPKISGPLTMKVQPDHEPTPLLWPKPNPDRRGGELIAVKDGWRVEEYGGPREHCARHRFSSVESFVAWLRHWTKNPAAAQVFANLPLTVFGAGDGRAVVRQLEACVDPRDTGSDRVTAAVALSPQFEAWANLCACGSVGQKPFFYFLRAWGETILVEAERVALVGALSALKVTTGGTFEAELAANGRLKVSGMRGEVSVSQEIPGEFEIAVPIYQTKDPDALYSIRVVLDVEAGPTGVSIGVSMPGIETTIAEANERLVEYVAFGIGPDFLVCAGASQFAEEPLEPSRKRAVDFETDTPDE